MSDEISIRFGDARDTNALVSFNRAMALETEAKELDLDLVTAGVENLIKTRQHGFYVVAEVNTSPSVAIGSLMVTFEWSDWRNGLFWWIQSVYIKPEYRRRGIYRRLYQFVKTMASAEERVCGFRLYVEKENRAAQLTYEQLGMKESHYVMYEELIESVEHD